MPSILVLVILVLFFVLLMALPWLTRRREDASALLAAEPGYILSVSDRLALLTVMAQELAGDAHLMVEGQTPKEVDLTGLGEISTEAPDGLQKHTVWSWPREDVLVVPLEPDTIDAVTGAFLPSLKLDQDKITHVQIERDGMLQFGAYDWFQFVWVSREAGAEIVESLKTAGVISNYDEVGMSAS